MSSVRTAGSPSRWTTGRVPGREVATIVVALLLTAAVINVVLAGRLGFLYDLAFVTLCVAAGLAVRPPDMYAGALLPPVAMVAIVVLLALTDRDAVARADDGFVQAVVSGISTHGLALAFGYGLLLGALALRRGTATNG